MKKSFLMTALAGLMLASCTFEEGKVEHKSTIDFTVAPYAAQTRAEHELNQAFNTDFKVWAWDADNDNAIIDGKVASYEIGSSAWEVVGGPYYWPDFDLDFVAIVPATANPYCAVERSSSGQTTIRYTFDNTNPNPRNVNLMHSDFADGLTKVTVPLGFRHALAHVEVVVTQKDVAIDPASNINFYEVVLESMSVDGIHRHGTYAVTSNNQNINNQVWTYDPADPATNIEYLATARSLNPSNVKTDYTPNDGNPIYVMPQNLSDDAKFNINYHVITHTTSGISTGATQSVSVQMNTITDAGANKISAWHTNKIIRYTINITPVHSLEGIQFEVKEEEWGEIAGSANV